MDYEAMEYYDQERCYCVESGVYIGLELLGGYAWERPFDSLDACLCWVNYKTA